MSQFSFIHCSDLHLDSPFSGLSFTRPEQKKILQEATFKSFQNIISLAIREKTDAVVIAGDVYDSATKSLRAQLVFRDGLARLAKNGIRSFIVHGNHDPLNTWSASLDWPELATVFPGDRVESTVVVRNGKPLATIYGISYPKRDVCENLVLRFNNPPEAGFAVGVLHANVGGNPDHENYAPCKIEDLISLKMDYWALGHVHNRKTLRDSSPAIVYCGNSQGRSFRETGPRGCCLVTLRTDQQPEVIFHETAFAKLSQVDVDISKSSSIDDAIRLVTSQLQKFIPDVEEAISLVRLRLTGRTSLHHELKRNESFEAVSEEIQNQFDGMGVWIDLSVETGGICDLESLRRGNNFLADMIDLYDENGRRGGLDEVREFLRPVFENWKGAGLLDTPSDDELKALLMQARDLSLDRLMGPE